MGDYSSSAETCPLVDFTPEPFECYYGLIRLYKSKSKHSKPLLIEPDSVTSLYNYEVVSGENSGISSMVLNVGGITIVNCKDHPNEIIAISFVAPTSPTINQNAENQFQAPTIYGYTIFPAVINYDIYIESCQIASKQIRVKIYPDRKVTLKVNGSIAATSTSGSVSIGFKLSGTWDGKSKEGNISGSLKKSIDGSEKLSWKMTAGGKWNAVTGKVYLKKYKRIYEIFKTIYERKLKLDSLVNSGLIQNKSKSGWGGMSFSMSGSVSYSNYWIEDAETHWVGLCTEWMWNGTFMKFSWKYDFTSKIFLTLGWVGKLLDIARVALEKAKRASLNAVVKLIGSFSVGDLNFTTVKLTNGVVRKTEGDKVKVTTFIGLDLLITGKMRVDSKTYGIEAGFKGSGVNCVLLSKKMKINFTGLKLVASVFHESYSAKSSSETPPDELVPGDTYEIKAKKEVLGEKTLKLIGNVLIYERDL